MLAAPSPLFPVLDEKKLPFSPRNTPGNWQNLEKFRWSFLPEIGRRVLTMTQYIVLDALIQHADHRTGYCFPSRRLIAEQIGIDPVTVSTATSRLEKLGIIAKFGQGGYSSSCDYVILFSQEAFSLAEMLHRGELNRFGLRNRSCPVPINLEEAIAYGLAASFNTEITGSSNPEIKRNEQAQIKGFILTSVDTQPEETTDSKPRKNPRRPSTPILKALPEHWLEDGKQKRPDLDIRHVADKFLAYHNRKGVRATPRWYAAWIRWLERENPALDRRSTPVQENAPAPARTVPGNTTQVANTPAERSPTVPQTGTSAPAAVTETPAPVAQETPSSADAVTAASPETTTTASTPEVTNTPSPAEPTASAPVDNTATPDSTTDGNSRPSVEATSQAPTAGPAAGFPDFGNDEQARRRHIEEVMTALRAGRAGAQRPGNQAGNSAHGASTSATAPQPPQEPGKRFTPPHRLMDLLRPGKAPSAPPQDQAGETPQDDRKTPTAGAGAPEPPIPVISDEERKRRLEELLVQAEGKTLRDFGPG